jgi:spoIIIJ-associated protein
MHTSMIQQTITDFFENFPMKVESINQSHDDEIDLEVFALKFSESTRELIGRDGETLRGINYLIRKIIEQKLGGDRKAVPNFLIDINNYYQNNIRELKTKATIIADRARSFKRSTQLEPMTAYDRLIVHSFLAKQPDIETGSEGEGKDRHVVVSYKEDTEI